MHIRPGFLVISLILAGLGAGLTYDHVYVLAVPTWLFCVVFLVVHFTGKRRGMWHTDRPTSTDREEEDQP